MKPLPWSYTALDDFVSCPHAFHQKRVLKRFKEEKSEQMIWGERVHKAFEDRMADGVRLPPDLEAHEFYMQHLETMPGEQFTERRIALSRDLNPCAFFDRDNVWFRGVIDYTKVNDNHAVIIDYKTGKQHNKFQQLQLFALHTFVQYPQVQTVAAKFYWTKISCATQEIYTRDQMPKLWSRFVPDLKQYAQAFRTETWQKRPSGLCRGWCPITDCEHWRPKKER